MSRIFALCDIDSAYTSCEKIFNLSLRNQPVIVASNNDGCAVARCKLAKQLGIKMGQPVFQLRQLINQHGLVVQSSNYALYGDMSSRFMQTLEAITPRVMPYSIDEAFCELTGIDALHDYEMFGRKIKDTVREWTGLPICVGISTTPTLAKLANRGAKKYPKTQGVVDLTNPQRQRKLLNLTKVGDIWGIGSKLSARLNELGIHTGLDLADADPKWIRQHFSVVVERTVRELNGVPCQDIEEVAPAKQQIICSKSFGSPITELDDMRAAVAQYAIRATEKLRGEHREARHLTVFLTTNRFQAANRYSNSAAMKLPFQTADSRVITQHAVALANQLWLDGYRYTKAGVMLADFHEPGTAQEDLFDPVADSERNQALMQAVDKINRTSGTGSVKFGRQAHRNTSWHMKRENLSPSYTTCWSDIPKVKC